MVLFFKLGSRNIHLFSKHLEIFFFFACALAQKSLDPLSIQFNVVEAGNARAAEIRKVFLWGSPDDVYIPLHLLVERVCLQSG